MPINLNLWTLMLTRWMDRSRQSNILTTIGLSGTSRDHAEGDRPRRGQAPPLDIERLSRHLRRDIGLDFDRV